MRGVYQYVKAGAAVARGQIVCWDTFAHCGIRQLLGHSLSPQQPTTGARLVSLPRSVTSGQYGFIQVSGLAARSVRYGHDCALSVTRYFRHTGTAVADAIGVTAVVAGGAGSVFETYIGVAENLPVSATITLVQLAAGVFVENWG